MKAAGGWRKYSKELLFFSLVAGMSITGGFGAAITMAKRREPTYFDKGFLASNKLAESGGSLALRALGRGTAYAVGGFTLFCVIVWKLSGFHSVGELQDTLRRVVPAAPRSSPPGRSEFTSLRELVNYLIDEDEKNKKTRRTTD